MLYKHLCYKLVNRKSSVQYHCISK